MSSQAEEDAIIARLNAAWSGRDPHRGTFVEIGVGTGYENNTLALARLGWRGLWVGNEPLRMPPPSGVTFVEQQVELDNVYQLPFPPRPIDLLSLDIDGNDFWIGQHLVPHLLPTILIVEYNSTWDGTHRIMPYTPGYVWHQGQPFGASLLSWIDFLSGYHYQLVYTTVAKVNAFFIRPGAYDGVIPCFPRQGEGDPQ